MPWDKVEIFLGRHVQEPPVDVRLRREPDGARDVARGPRGGVGRHRQGKGDRGPNARREPRVLPCGRRACLERQPRDDARGGGPARHRAGRQVRRARAARGHQPVHDQVGDGAGRAGPHGRRAWTTTGGTAGRSPSSPGSRRSRWTSRPATTEYSTTWRWATRAPSSTRAPTAGRFSGARCSAWGTRSRRRACTTSTTACRWRSGCTRVVHPRYWTYREICSGDAVNLPDPESPGRARRGIGEPPVAAGACAVLNALSAALGR